LQFGSARAGRNERDRLVLDGSSPARTSGSSVSTARRPSRAGVSPLSTPPHPPRPRGQPGQGVAVRPTAIGGGRAVGVIWPLFRPFLCFFGAVAWRARPGQLRRWGRPVQRTATTEPARDWSRRHMCHPPLPATWPARPQAGCCSHSPSCTDRKLLPFFSEERSFCFSDIRYTCETQPHPRLTVLCKRTEGNDRGRAVTARGRAGVRACVPKRAPSRVWTRGQAVVNHASCVVPTSYGLATTSASRIPRSSPIPWRTGNTEHHNDCGAEQNKSGDE